VKTHHQPFREADPTPSSKVQIPCGGDVSFHQTGPNAIQLRVSEWTQPDDPNVEPTKVTTSASFNRGHLANLRDAVDHLLAAE
jgi:hypothetical protein